MPGKIWLEDESGNTYRVNNNETYVFRGKATSKAKKDLTKYLNDPSGNRPREWSVVRVSPLPQETAPRPTDPIRISSPVPKYTTKNGRCRMALARRDASM